MTAEEIREGIAERIDPDYCVDIDNLCDGYEAAYGDAACRYCCVDQVMAYLRSQGAVLKVEREMPENFEVNYTFDYKVQPYRENHPFDNPYGRYSERYATAYKHGKEALRIAGYAAVEPLIGGE